MSLVLLAEIAVEYKRLETKWNTSTAPKKLSSPCWQVFLFIWRSTWHLIFIFALSYVILNLASEILVAGKPELSAPVGDLLMMWKNKQLSFLSTSWIYPSYSCCIWYFNWKRMLAVLPSNLTATCMWLSLDAYPCFAATLIRKFLLSWFLLVHFIFLSSCSEIVDYSECVMAKPYPKGHIFWQSINDIKIMTISYMDDYL